MTLAEDILAALRAAGSQDRPLVYPKTGRTWQVALLRHLGVLRAEDKTAYPHGRAYQFDCRLSAAENPHWDYLLRVRIAAVGPFAVHNFVQVSRLTGWWAGSVRVSAGGFLPEHGEVLERLRAWYAAQGLRAVDAATQALPVPEAVSVPGPRPDHDNLYHALFS